MSAPFAEWEAVVFDLDGTLVHLIVDWDAVEVAIRDALRGAEVAVDGADVWTHLDRARRAGALDSVEEIINAYEIDGAARSERLPLAGLPPVMDVPTAVCSLNCEAACHRALTTHGIDGGIDVIVGRDTVRPWKPDPTPLETAIERLGASPEGAIFVGDSRRDERTAQAADVAFVDVDEAVRWIA